MHTSLHDFQGRPLHVATEADGTLLGQKSSHQMLSASRSAAKKSKNLYLGTWLRLRVHPSHM